MAIHGVYCTGLGINRFSNLNMLEHAHLEPANSITSPSEVHFQNYHELLFFLIVTPTIY